MRHTTKALLLLATLASLSSCTGFLGLEYDSKRYAVGAKHVAMGQLLAGVAQGDGEYEYVMAQKCDMLTAWVERDGKAVDRIPELRTLYPNPWWPFPYRKATKRGTPAELGLLDAVGVPRGHRWLLHVPEELRIVGHYRACAATYPDTVIATNGNVYWLEATIGGKRYAEIKRGNFMEHYGKPPKGWTVLWRGSLAQMEALRK